MAKQDWLDYFDLLNRLADTLDEIAAVQDRKIVAVNKGDLDTVDEIMKKEQVFAMTLRGYEQKRITALAKLAVPAGPLSDLLKSVPMELRVQGKRVVTNLQEKYARYQSASGEAKKSLEMNLEQLESISGIVSGYEKPKPKKERSLEGGPLVKTQAPGNVPLNIEQLRHQNAATPPKIVPVSQQTLAEGQAAFEGKTPEKKTVSPQGTSGGSVEGSGSLGLRQLAQQEEKRASSGAATLRQQEEKKKSPEALLQAALENKHGKSSDKQDFLV